MTAHGWGSHGDQVLGSIADRILRTSPVPVLLVPREAVPLRLPRWDRFVIAVNGSSEAALVLEPVLALARTLNAKVTLVRVYPEVARAAALRPGDSKRVLGRAISTFMTPVVAGLATRARAAAALAGIQLVYGEPAPKIVEVAQQLEASAIALATHGRSPFERQTFGSVAVDVISKSRLPVLLFGPQVLRTLAHPARVSMSDGRPAASTLALSRKR